MRLALLPVLTDGDKEAVGRWVEATLAAPNLCQGDWPFPLANKVGVYVDGSLRVLERGEFWQDDGVGRIWVGYRHRSSANHLSEMDRLAVVGAIISLAELWERFHGSFIAKAAQIIFTAYEGMMGGMIQTEAAVTGLAFNADRSLVAGRIGDCYHLPNGTAVEIDDTWTLVPDRPTVRSAVAG